MALCSQKVDQVDLLIGLVNEGRALRRGATGTAAIFVDPAAHRIARRSQLTSHPTLPEEQPATGLLRIEGHPQQAAMGGVQLGEIGAGGCGLLSAPDSVGVGYALHISREALSLRYCSSSSPSGASSACWRASRIRS